MREIKERHRLSYGRLAAMTHYSRSSWERFLNGKQLPTRVAVEELAAVGGEGPERLIALWEETVAAEQNGEAPAAGTEPDGGSGTDGTRVADGTTPANGADGADGSAGTAGTAGSTAGDAGARTPVGAAADSAAGGGSAPSAGPADTGTAPSSAVPPLPGRGPQLTLRRRLSRVLVAAAYVTAGALLGSLLTTQLDKDPAGTSGAQAPAPGRTAPGDPVAPASGETEVGCEGDTCLRREPQAMDCHWDASTVRETWLRGLQVQLRYSKACQAVWGRIENGTVGDRVVIDDQHGRSEEATIRVGTDTYTRMLAVSATTGPETVRICGVIKVDRRAECDPLGPVQP
ncbi:DUF2690 domain-containing protein [Streptomyces omiyaensis]|uniref:DUF2690 domain-containing protein n=1 Tax=Streptomyces omiyaensis TaxID=68247 RepID=UPI0036F5CFAA